MSILNLVFYVVGQLVTPICDVILRSTVNNFCSVLLFPSILKWQHDLARKSKVKMFKWNFKQNRTVAQKLKAEKHITADAHSGAIHGFIAIFNIRNQDFIGQLVVNLAFDALKAVGLAGSGL